ncbi:MAG: methyltransferase domain-containing protein [Methylocystaceae bacterium]
MKKIKSFNDGTVLYTREKASWVGLIKNLQKYIFNHGKHEDLKPEWDQESTHCEICRSKLKQFYKYKESEIHLCPNCGLYTASGIDFDFELNANIDWDAREDALKKVRIHNFKIITDYLKRHLPPQAVGLEVGSAYGWFLDMINHDYQCSGIEPHKEIADTNQKHTVFNGFFPYDLPEEISNLDFIVFNDVLEHIPNCNQVISQCYSLLKENGLIIVNIPLSTGILFRIANNFARFGYDNDLIRLWQFKFNSPHLYYFNKNNLILLGKKHGFNFLYYQDLMVLDKTKIHKRVTIDATQKHAWIKSLLVMLLWPILNLCSKDVGFVVLQKTIGPSTKD